jgi:hypothetical protein
MATIPGLPHDFDPEAHVDGDTDAATAIPEGVAALTPYLVTKRRSMTDSPSDISCWHCYTDGEHT